ncbi:uncharacterized protein LOC117334575 isoform X1 [Pecten maximus]|uniref:uncharacterized protein LOC117334575 isoform X1 n=1 Tax=Pecten maximus TaxID=6579 RepID=UPI0014585D4C|nr:uncharacterized protein LOC117334575 isoform X1 [Pecten maximus]XP_033750159.1 uncharacterized protein LOC117334575 isoform X1 [Pecten maximus]
MKSSMAGRLTMSSLLAPSLDSSLASNTSSQNRSSASLTKAEKEIKALKAENNKLRKDLEDVRSLYNQLVSENSHEKFDERRITLLKSHIIQLERQVLLMSEALSSRSGALMEVENALTWLADKCRHYIALEVPGATVSVPRSDFTQMVHTAESSRIKLFKNIENCSTQTQGQALMFMNAFIKPQSFQNCTLLDIASGRLDYINLKHVSKLESKLSSLYKDLTQLHDVLETPQDRSVMTSSCVASVIRDRASTQLLRSCARLKDCCGDLLSLSLLYPSAPWPPLKKSMLKDVTCDHVMASLPSLPKSKIPEVKRVMTALLKAQSYHHHMLSQQIKGLKEEVKFHQAVYNLQISYSETLLTAVREGYRDFEKSTNEFLIKPLRDILEAYLSMKTSGSETGLRQFLTCFKNSEDQLMDAVLKLSTEGKHENGSGAEVLSQFGEEFTKSLDKAVKQSQWRRDKAGKERAELKEEQKKLEEELQSLLDKQESSFQDMFPQSDDTLAATDRSTISGNEDSEASTKNRHSAAKSNIDNRFSLHESGSLNKDPLAQCTENVSRLSLEEKSSIQGMQRDNSPSNSRGIKPPRSSRRGNSLPDRKHRSVSRSGNIQRVSSPSEGRQKNEGQEGKLHAEISSLENKEEGRSSSVPGIPPVGKKTGKVKKEQKYLPNTFVPNRTLKLRRAGSLSSLSDQQDTGSDTESVSSQTLRGVNPGAARKSTIPRRSISRSGHS